jgi:ABC-type proline/glycine betaine transport system substrate-binding protein
MKLAVFATLLAAASAFSIKADLGKVRIIWLLWSAITSYNSGRYLTLV